MVSVTIPREEASILLILTSFFILPDIQCDIVRDYLIPELTQIYLKTDYLSTSPKTKSIVPIMATASANKLPLEIWSKAPKWAKPGALILHL